MQVIRFCMRWQVGHVELNGNFRVCTVFALRSSHLLHVMTSRIPSRIPAQKFDDTGCVRRHHLTRTYLTTDPRMKQLRTDICSMCSRTRTLGTRGTWQRCKSRCGRKRFVRGQAVGQAASGAQKGGPEAIQHHCSWRLPVATVGRMSWSNLRSVVLTAGASSQQHSRSCISWLEGKPRQHCTSDYWLLHPCTAHKWLLMVMTASIATPVCYTDCGPAAAN